MKQAARTKKEKAHVKAMLKHRLKDIQLPAIVVLTRVGPRALDYDNMVGSLKSIRDAVADLLIPGLPPGRADGDPRLEWSYKQKKGLSREYAVIVEVLPLPKEEDLMPYECTKRTGRPMC